VAVESFRERGFLPEALVNYLALLGWSYDETTTFFDRSQLVKRFDLARVSHNPAAFDAQKLEWMNGHYIREASDTRLAELVSDELLHQGLDVDLSVVASAIPLIKERMRTVVEGASLIRFLFEDVTPDQKAAKLLGPDRADYLMAAIARLEAVEAWTHQGIEAALRSLRDEWGLSATKAFQPIRAAVTGTLVSPPLFESLALLGRERTLDRLRAAAAPPS